MGPVCLVFGSHPVVGAWPILCGVRTGLFCGRQWPASGRVGLLRQVVLSGLVHGGKRLTPLGILSR